MQFDFDLKDYLLLSVSVAAFGIGVHQYMYFGMGASYWLFMLALGVPFYMQYRRTKRKLPIPPSKAEKLTTKSTKKILKTK